MSKATKRRQPEEPAVQLADDLRDQAAAVMGEIAEFLRSVPDEKLFGDTEFVVRDQVLKLVASAFTARLAQKKTATSAVAPSVPTADEPPSSTAIASAIP